MTKNKKVLIAKMACVLAVIPVSIYAHEYGPDPYHTSAPGDNPTSCIEAQCHVGKLNSFGGKVEILVADGTYTPGATQRVVVRITDAVQKSWGFQLTARLASNPAGTQAGDFNTVDPDSQTSPVQVLCADGSLKNNGGSCPAALNQQFAEHNRIGWAASRGTVGTYSYEVNWTAPATNVGDVVMYVGANASNGTNNESAGHIYTASVKLAPLVDSGKKPQVTQSNGVVNGATNLASGIAPNTYITIFGTNLANPTFRQWGAADFGAAASSLPTSLSTTSVTVNGKAAFVEFVSSTQINAITPPDTAAGSGIPVVVTRNGISSDPVTITIGQVAPGFFTFDGKYVAAADQASGSFIGKTGLFPSAPNITAPAKPGQIITLYGTGFGPTSPAIAAGIVTDQDLQSKPNARRDGW